MKSALLLSVIAVCVMGCTDLQLQTNSVRESLTVLQIEQQQVLDNLALFVCDYHSMPSFSYPNLGSSIVIDTGSAGMTPTWSRVTQGPTAGQFLFTALGLSLTGSRQAQESFTLQPTNDPRKLELMRCAYQRAVASCGFAPPEAANQQVTATFDPAGGGRESQRCPDCEAIFNRFYTGDPNGVIHDHAQGITTSDCLKSESCWFHTGCKKCVPKHCGCVGHCGDVYVWVLPEGRDQLSKLTLVILDYAINNPPVGLTKQVVYYIDEYGIPTQQKSAVGQVTASIAIDERNASLLSTSTGEESRLERIINARLTAVNEEMNALAMAVKASEKRPSDNREGKSANQQGQPPAVQQSARPPEGSSPKNDPNFERYKQLLDEKQMLEMKLAYLQEQLLTPGLKQRFYQANPTPSQGILFFNNYQDTVRPGGASAAPPLAQ